MALPFSLQHNSVATFARREIVTWNGIPAEAAVAFQAQGQPEDASKAMTVLEKLCYGEPTGVIRVGSMITSDVSPPPAIAVRREITEGEYPRLLCKVFPELCPAGTHSSESRPMVLIGNMGGIHMPNDKIEGSNVVGPVNIKSQLTRVTQTVKNAPKLADDTKNRLATLIEELEKALQSVRDERPEDAERLASSAELVATEVAKQKPSRSFLRISCEGLKEAAQVVGDIAPTVIPVVAKMSALLSGLGI
jgi:hypothetical protein